MSQTYIAIDMPEALKTKAGKPSVTKIARLEAKMRRDIPAGFIQLGIAERGQWLSMAGSQRLWFGEGAEDMRQLLKSYVADL